MSGSYWQHSRLRSCVAAVELAYLLSQTGAEESLHLISFFINMFHQTLASSNMLSQWAHNCDCYIRSLTLYSNGTDRQRLRFSSLLTGYIVALARKYLDFNRASDSRTLLNVKPRLTLDMQIKYMSKFVLLLPRYCKNPDCRDTPIH